LRAKFSRLINLSSKSPGLLSDVEGTPMHDSLPGKVINPCPVNAATIIFHLACETLADFYTASSALSILSKACSILSFWENKEIL
jgi:hypothetical protein